MKKIIIIFLCLSILKVHAQCQTSPCTNVITFPISTNDFNNSSGIYAGYGPNRCIEGQGTFGPNLNIPNNANWWSFNGTGTGIDITQTLNMNTGMRGYLSGVNNLHHLHMAGGSDSAIIYCADNSYTICTVNQANNSTNYVYLGNGSTFFINGTLYQAGDTYQGQGNSTNVIHFVGCSQNQPLGTNILLYQVGKDFIKWEIAPIGFREVEILYSPDDINVNPDSFKWSTIATSIKSDDKYTVEKSGVYRIKVGNEYSFMTNFIIKEPAQEQPKRVELYRIPELNLIATKIIR